MPRRQRVSMTRQAKRWTAGGTASSREKRIAALQGAAAMLTMAHSRGTSRTVRRMALPRRDALPGADRVARGAAAGASGRRSTKLKRRVDHCGLDLSVANECGAGARCRGAWGLVERRNVLEDYRKIFGGEPAEAEERWSATGSRRKTRTRPASPTWARFASSGRAKGGRNSPPR